MSRTHHHRPPRSAYRYVVERLKWKNRHEETSDKRWAPCQNGLARFVFLHEAQRFLELYAEGIARTVDEGQMPKTFALRIVRLARGDVERRVLYKRTLWRAPSADASDRRAEACEPSGKEEDHEDRDDEDRAERDAGDVDAGVRGG